MQKPFMERRAYGTFRKQWPQLTQVTVTSPDLSFEDYLDEEHPFEKVVNIMVGDLQRVQIYGERGDQEHQDIPTHVMEAFHVLVSRGYDRHLLDT